VKIAKFLKKSRTQEALSLEQVVFEEIPKAGISQKGMQIIEKLKNQIKELRKHLNLPVWKIILEVYEISGLNRAFSATETREEAECLMNLRELVEIAKEFEENHGEGIAEFIDYLELLDSMGAGSSEKILVEEKAVRLMSIHGAKGLEAEHVFLIGFSKDKIPLFRGGTEPLIPVELIEFMASQLDGLNEK
ncbi:MAG: 3'-5' exonuclease, partial [Candidatus Diapherotrites archaeon]|nr:3'-5' exonuclease [Candidatus Diapherotrites archaeon]